VRLQQQNTQQAGLAAGLLCTDLEEMERLTMQRLLSGCRGKEQAQKLLGFRGYLVPQDQRYGIRTRQEVFARGQSG